DSEPVTATVEILDGAIGEFVAPGDTYLKFGKSVSLDEHGTRLAVGSTSGPGGPGNVNIYERSATTWGAPQSLSIPEIEHVTRVLLSADGEVLVVAAFEENKVFVYHWSDTAWMLADNGPLGAEVEHQDGFGGSVDLSADGRTIVVGVPNESFVYTFTRSGSSWEEESAIEGASPDSKFGAQVAIDGAGDIVVVGAPNAGATGVVNVYERQTTPQVWVPSQILPEPSDGVATGARFGSLLALSSDGTRLVVAADDAGVAGVHIYSWSDALAQEQHLEGIAGIVENGDFWGGLSLNADGTVLAIGASKDDSDAAGLGGEVGSGLEQSGAVHVFARQGGQAQSIWTPRAFVKAAKSNAGDWFGSSVALSDDGESLAVGAEASLGYIGAVYLY
ncbi:MAG: hypothetical protein KC431_15050, partial [Myxococcales bacterium]|nr:hypothetical protein [Myxococcales bacterium]